MAFIDKPSILKLNAQWQPVCFTNVKTTFPDMTTGALIGLHISWGQDDDGNWDFESPIEVWPVDKWEDWLQLEIREYDDVVRTVDREVRVPKIVIAPNFNKMPSVRTKLSKRAIFERDGFTCQYTGKKVDPAKANELFNIDHVTPRSRGGDTSWGNVVTSLKTVNSDKRNMTPCEAGLKLLQKPMEPRPQTLAEKVRDLARHHADEQHKFMLK